MVSSIDGLVSGLSTSALIDQLMQAESQGRTRLKDKVTAQQKITSAFQSLNTKVASLKTAATDLSTATTWAATKATSSATDVVTATSSSNATAGTYSVTIDQLAQTHSRMATVSRTESLTDGTGVKITSGDKTYDVTLTSQTAQGVVNGINAAGAGVWASLVNTDSGTVLQVTATKSGAVGQFDISGLKTATTVATTGRDAELTLSGGHTVTSSSNTFTGAIPGVTLTAVKEGAATISVASDASGLADKVTSLVGLANSLLSDAKSKSALPDPNNPSSTAGPLAGNFLVRTLTNDVLGTVSKGVTGYGSLASLGIETTKDGTITFNRSTFLNAYQQDPNGVKAAISGSLAPAMKSLATGVATNITAVIQNGNSTIKSLNTQIESWTTRLNMRREALQKQFTNLEVALGKLQDQSNWLAGQISSLSSSS